MKDNEIEKFLGKNVIVFFTNGSTSVGVLEKGETCYGNKWIGNGYHLIRNFQNDIGFKKSHVRKITEA